MRSRLFQKLPDELRASERLELRLAKTDKAKIQHAAAIRNLTVSDYVLRATLGRKAEIRYETEIVVQLVDLIRVLREIHADLKKTGRSPSLEGFRPLVDEVRAAIIRIQK